MICGVGSELQAPRWPPGPPSTAAIFCSRPHAALATASDGLSAIRSSGGSHDASRPPAFDAVDARGRPDEGDVPESYHTLALNGGNHTIVHYSPPTR